MSTRRSTRHVDPPQAAAQGATPPSPRSQAQVATGSSGPPTAAAIAADPSVAATTAAAFVAAAMAAAAKTPTATTATAPGPGTSTPAPRSPATQVTPTPLGSVAPTTSAAQAPLVQPPVVAAPPGPPPLPPQPPMAAAPPPPPRPDPNAMPDAGRGAPGSPGPSEPSSHASSSDAESGEDVTKVSNRLDAKNIRVSKFTGIVPKGKFDSGVQEWWNDFQEEVEVAQVLSGQRWSDRAKKLLLSSFLEDMARRWYKRYRVRVPDSSFVDTGNALVSEFRPKLSYQDLTKMLIEEPRKFNESFREYADRLVSIAENLEGGIEVAANQRQALMTFVRRAWTPLAGEYERQYELDNADPLELLEYFITKLSKDVGHDGRGTGKKHVDPQKRRKAEKHGHRQAAEQAQGHAAVVERKRKPPHKPNQSYNQRRGQFACYKCGSPGHTAKYHDQHLGGDDKLKTYGPAASQQGEQA